MKANYHTHTSFCDGKAPPEAMAREALARGYSILGFSAHAPLPFEAPWALEASRMDAYAEAVRDLRPSFPGMEILLGLETDYVPGLALPRDPAYEVMELDYRIGSVHIVQGRDGLRFPVDEPAALFASDMARGFGNDGLGLAKAYYRLLTELAQRGGFEILGHFDLVMKNNGSGAYFDPGDPAYIQAYRETIEALRGKDIIVEINTGSVARGRAPSPYPSLSILKELRAANLPVVIGADAHRPEHLSDEYYEIGRELALAAGYRELTLLGLDGARFTEPL